MVYIHSLPHALNFVSNFLRSSYIIVHSLSYPPNLGCYAGRTRIFRSLYNFIIDTKQQRLRLRTT